MNKKIKIITVSAPGKLMLFGEHAVVYNHPCIVTAVDQRMKATIERIETNEFHIDVVTGGSDGCMGTMGKRML